MSERYAPNTDTGRGICLFDGDDIRLIVQDNKSDVVFVTFTPRPALEKNGSFSRLGFAQRLVERRKYSGVYFISKWPHWWQSPELPVVEAIVRDLPFLKNAKRRLCYGGSMGGFGVLLSASRIGCERGLVVAPQVSMDPALVPFENRWNEDLEAIQFIEPDSRTGIGANCQYYVLYDEFHKLDRQHVDMLEGYPQVEFLSVPYGGHNILEFMLKIGVLKDFVRDVTMDNLHFDQVLRSIRGVRRNYTQYYEKMYLYAFEKDKKASCGLIAKHWFQFDPASLHAFKRYTKFLAEGREKDSEDDEKIRFEALVETSKIYVRTGADRVFGLQQQRLGLYSLGRYAEALEVALEVCTLQDSIFNNWRWAYACMNRLRQYQDIIDSCRTHFDSFRTEIRFLRAYFEALVAAKSVDEATRIGKLVLAHPQVSFEDKERVETARELM